MKNNHLEVIYYIEQEMRKVVTRLLPRNEIRFLPPINAIKETNSILPIGDYIYVIDKFIRSKIIPVKWKIFKSEDFEKSPLKEQYIERINQLEKMLRLGDVKVNSPGFNYLPKSHRRYFKTAYDDKTNKRYNIDFTDSFYGIKHFHLNQKHNDDLLFYVISYPENSIYFLYLGQHEDLYNRNVLEIIIRKYPQLMEILGIGKLIGIIPGKEDPDSKTVKKVWESGGNLLFAVDNILYSGGLQSSAGTDSRNTYILQNLFWQIDNQINEYLSKLYNNLNHKKEKYYIEILNPQKNYPIDSGILLIKEKDVTIIKEIYIDFLSNIKYVKMINEEISKLK